MEATFYGGYVQRLNRLNAAFAPLTEAAIAEVDSEAVAQTLRIADSFPVMMAKETRLPRKQKSPLRLPTRAIAPRNAFPTTV